MSDQVSGLKRLRFIHNDDGVSSFGEPPPLCPVSLQACERAACADGCGYVGDWPPPSDTNPEDDA